MKGGEGMRKKKGHEKRRDEEGEGMKKRKDEKGERMRRKGIRRKGMRKEKG